MIRAERKFMHHVLNNKLKSFTAYDSDVNYYLIQLRNCNSTLLRDTLLERNGILVRDCSDFKGMNDKYIRVAVKTHNENLQLLNSLEVIDT